MNIDLSALEARVVGCLVEKQITTPEQYPLSLNALHNACNQKSNRDPLMQLTEPEVQATLDALARKHLVIERSGFGSRVPKFQQRLCNTDFSVLQLTVQERAILCELLLRGPQTPGELRSRAARMASFGDVAEVERALETMAHRQTQPLVHALPREPGRREVRYRHALGSDRDAPAEAPPDVVSTTVNCVRSAVPGGGPALAAEHPDDLRQRLGVLERQMAQLLEDVATLKRHISDDIRSA